ncbi:hypothetical protein BJ508DRAFT_365576 [Ascobolus immersus RN42]|uniref:Uncharacterized protein n=1 Tax=Ascobolus immersus RN42 TaxID=1160509 RepID=A0A3N4HP00_ASCIM|nr:hypothetical protein BJ508DRAFT_365576 [Ascobolus immersus RN42]
MPSSPMDYGSELESVPGLSRSPSTADSGNDDVPMQETASDTSGSDRSIPDIIPQFSHFQYLGINAELEWAKAVFVKKYNEVLLVSPTTEPWEGPLSSRDDTRILKFALCNPSTDALAGGTADTFYARVGIDGTFNHYWFRVFEPFRKASDSEELDEYPDLENPSHIQQDAASSMLLQQSLESPMLESPMLERFRELRHRVPLVLSWNSMEKMELPAPATEALEEDVDMDLEEGEIFEGNVGWVLYKLSNSTSRLVDSNVNSEPSSKDTPLTLERALLDRNPTVCSTSHMSAIVRSVTRLQRALYLISTAWARDNNRLSINGIGSIDFCRSVSEFDPRVHGELAQFAQSSGFFTRSLNSSDVCPYAGPLLTADDSLSGSYKATCDRIDACNTTFDWFKARLEAALVFQENQQQDLSLLRDSKQDVLALVESRIELLQRLGLLLEGVKELVDKGSESIKDIVNGSCFVIRHKLRAVDILMSQNADIGAGGFSGFGVHASTVPEWKFFADIPDFLHHSYSWYVIDSTGLRSHAILAYRARMQEEFGEDYLKWQYKPPGLESEPTTLRKAWASVLLDIDCAISLLSNDCTAMNEHEDADIVLPAGAVFQTKEVALKGWLDEIEPRISGPQPTEEKRRVAEGYQPNETIDPYPFFFNQPNDPAKFKPLRFRVVEKYGFFEPWY